MRHFLKHSSPETLLASGLLVTLMAVDLNDFENLLGLSLIPFVAFVFFFSQFGNLIVEFVVRQVFVFQHIFR